MVIHYQMPLYRPPSEGNSLIIQATLGCSFNQCSFCCMYREKKYTRRPLDEVFQEIHAAAARQPEIQRVFLADGDALSLPTESLTAILQTLSSALPRLTRVSCYATPGNILSKSSTALQQLQRQGLRLLYLGIESGSDRILKKITKGATQKSIARAMRKAHDAGMKVSGTVILGLGGKTHWKTHIDGTVALLNQAPITYLSTLQLYLDDSVADEFYHKFAEPFQMPDDRAILQEQIRLIRGLNPPRPIIFRSNHASNALALAGTLPKEREQLLRQLHEALDGERQLRPKHLRGL